MVIDVLLKHNGITLMKVDLLSPIGRGRSDPEQSIIGTGGGETVISSFIRNLFLIHSRVSGCWPVHTLIYGQIRRAGDETADNHRK